MEINYLHNYIYYYDGLGILNQISCEEGMIVR